MIIGDYKISKEDWVDIVWLFRTRIKRGMDVNDMIHTMQFSKMGILIPEIHKCCIGPGTTISQHGGYVYGLLPSPLKVRQYLLEVLFKE